MLAKNFLWLAAAVALVAAPVAQAITPAAAAETPPVAVVSIAPTDNLVEKVSHLADIAGVPGGGAIVKALAPSVLIGVDTKKPIGVLVTMSDAGPKAVAFLPIADPKPVLEKLEEQIGKATDLGDGVLQFGMPVPMVLKAQDGWTFIAQTPDQLKDLPKEPGKYVAGLTGTYDVAVRLLVSNVPPELKEMVVAQLTAAFARAEEDLDEEEAETFKAITAEAKKQIAQLVKETDNVTLGLNINTMAKKIQLDLSIVAVAGTDMAKQMANLKNSKTDFGGFILPDAAVLMNLFSVIPMDQIPSTVAQLTELKKKAMEQIDKDEDLPDEASKAAAKDVLGKVIDAFIKTVEEGILDGAASLTLKDGGSTLIVGGRTADGAKLEEAFKKVISLAKEEPGFPEVKMDADSVGDVKLHVASIAVPDDGEARAVLGDRVDLVVGIGPKTVAFGAGKDVLAQVKKALTDSKATAGKPVMPMELTLDVGTILNFAAANSPDPQVKLAAEELKKAGENDKVSLLVMPIENGEMIRLQLGESILGALGKIGMARIGGGKPEPAPGF